MKIALAQIESIDGDVDANVARHLGALRLLQAGDAELVIFPELSLTNYEPAIAARAALVADDPRLAPLEDAARELNAGICVGAPLETADKPSISAILFSPSQARRIVHKAYLHEDETPLFAAGVEQASVFELTRRVALAICFDISVNAHIEQAAAQGMDIYLASVAKTAEGIAAARESLQTRAREYGVPVLVVNSVGYCEGRPAGGNSTIFCRDGSIVDALDDREQAVLIFDSVSGQACKLPLA